VYKELTPIKKYQVDLENAMVWIPDSKTPNGIAEVPLTPIAAQAFRDQRGIAGPGPYLFPSDKNPSVHQTTLNDAQGRLAQDPEACEDSVLSVLRLTLEGLAKCPAGHKNGGRHN
jgi:integrase